MPRRFPRGIPADKLSRGVFELQALLEVTLVTGFSGRWLLAVGFLTDVSGSILALGGGASSP